MFLKLEMALTFIKEASKQVYSFLGGYGAAKLLGWETEKPNPIIVQPRADVPMTTNNNEEKHATSEIVTVVLILLALGMELSPIIHSFFIIIILIILTTVYIIRH